MTGFAATRGKSGETCLKEPQGYRTRSNQQQPPQGEDLRFAASSSPELQGTGIYFPPSCYAY
jgi:hypothetical protein